MQRWSLSLSSLLLCLLLPWPSTGQFQVIGPRSPIIAKVGGEAVFSCRLNPTTDAQHMGVSWFQNNHSGLVHFYEDSQDHLEQQRPEYQGRTEFLKEHLTRGQVSLRIRPVLPTDGADYRCLFASSMGHSEAQFHVVVTASPVHLPSASEVHYYAQGGGPVVLSWEGMPTAEKHITLELHCSTSGLAPHIRVETGHNKSTKLTCTSTGWYPEPEVEWSGPGRLYLEPDSETRTVEENGLFRVESNLTLKERFRKVSCSVRNPVLREEKEAYVSMAGGLFPRASPWTVVLAVLLGFLSVDLLVTGAVFLRTEKAKEQRKFLGIEEDIILDEDTAYRSLSELLDEKQGLSLLREQDIPECPK